LYAPSAAMVRMRNVRTNFPRPVMAKKRGDVVASEAAMIQTTADQLSPIF
jgi:hypothetical protein